MTFVEQRQAELKSNESMSCLGLARTLSIATALATVSPSFADVSHIVGGTTKAFNQASSSLRQTKVIDARDAGDLQVFEAMNSIYTDLLSSQQELDESAQSVLYENLWDMYE